MNFYDINHDGKLLSRTGGVNEGKSTQPRINPDGHRFLMGLTSRLLRQNPIKPGHVCACGIIYLDGASATVENRLQVLPRHGRHEIRRVLDGVIHARLSDKLKLKSIGQQHYRLQLRSVQRLYVNHYVGGDAGRVVVVVSREGDGVIAGIGPLMRNARPGVGDCRSVAKRPFDTGGASGDGSLKKSGPKSFGRTDEQIGLRGNQVYRQGTDEI